MRAPAVKEAGWLSARRNRTGASKTKEDMMSIRTALMMVGCLAMAGCVTSGVSKKSFSSIEQYTLTNKNGMVVKITNYGATITSIQVPDRDGNLSDVALGYDAVEGYINAVDRPYFGSVVGRYGNRIAKGEFTLDGETFTLATNNGENHLHGGNMGFDKVVWDAVPTGNGVELTYLSRDGEEGYPGNLRVKVQVYPHRRQCHRDGVYRHHR